MSYYSLFILRMRIKIFDLLQKHLQGNITEHSMIFPLGISECDLNLHLIDAFAQWDTQAQWDSMGPTTDSAFTNSLPVYKSRCNVSSVHPSSESYCTFAFHIYSSTPTFYIQTLATQHTAFIVHFCSLVKLQRNSQA